MPHTDNSTLSEEEVDHIAALVERLLGRPYRRARFLNGRLEIKTGLLTGRDILITAPYNMQVNALRKRLGDRARVGTVDKFQGQEAPVAIHSLTASDGDSASRGLDFLLAPNRVNVAISRAQCLSIVVGSPQLATDISSSISNVEQLSRLCRLMQGSRAMAGASRIDRPHEAPGTGQDAQFITQIQQRQHPLMAANKGRCHCCGS